jgi:hypothetical protein
VNKLRIQELTSVKEVSKNMNSLIEKVLKKKFEDSTLSLKIKKEVEAFLASKSIISDKEL